MTPTHARDLITRIYPDNDPLMPFTMELKEMFSAAEQQTEGKPLSREHIREYLRLLFSETRFARFELEEVSYSLDRDKFVTGPRGLVGHNWETNLCWEVGLRHQPGGEIKMVFHARTTDSVR